MEDVEKWMRRFKRFLKEENIYNSFKTNFYKQVNKRITWSGNYTSYFLKCVDNPSFSDFCLSLKDARELLNFSFEWSNTKEGHEFWLEKSKKWREY